MSNKAKEGEHPENKKYLIIEDATYHTRFTKKFLQRKKWKKANPKLIISIIPGMVLEVYVKEGDKVKAGNHLLVLEAMKMKNYIEMPFDGKILKINITKGQNIPKGFLMMEIE